MQVVQLDPDQLAELVRHLQAVANRCEGLLAGLQVLGFIVGVLVVLGWWGSSRGH